MTKTGFGVIGAGIVGGDLHAQVYHRMPQAELVAICDLDEARAREVAERYDAPHIYTDYRDLLARSDIAAVSIATPDFAHREIAVAAAEAGKHILVEKPLATTVEDAEAILRAADAAGVKLMVDFQNRVNPAFVATRKAVLDGDLGELKYIYARLSNTTFVPTQMLPWASKSSALWFLASHTLDMSCWLLQRTGRSASTPSAARASCESWASIRRTFISPLSNSSAAPSSLWRTAGFCRKRNRTSSTSRWNCWVVKASCTLTHPIIAWWRNSRALTQACPMC